MQALSSAPRSRNERTHEQGMADRLVRNLHPTWVRARRLGIVLGRPQVAVVATGVYAPPLVLPRAITAVNTVISIYSERLDPRT